MAMAYDGFQKRSQKGPPQVYGGYGSYGGSGGYRGQGAAWVPPPQPPQSQHQHSPYEVNSAPPPPQPQHPRKSHMQRSAPPTSHSGLHSHNPLTHSPAGYRWGPPPPQRTPPPHFQHPTRQPPPNTNGDWDFGRVPPRTSYSTPLNPNAPTYSRAGDSSNSTEQLLCNPVPGLTKPLESGSGCNSPTQGATSPSQGPQSQGANSPSIKTESSVIEPLPADVSWGDLQDEEDDMLTSNPGGGNSFSSMGTPMMKTSFAQSSPTTPSAVIDVSTPPTASLKPSPITPVRHIFAGDEEERTGWSRKGSPKAVPKKGTQPTSEKEGVVVDATVAALRAKMADKKKVSQPTTAVNSIIVEGETVTRGLNSIGGQDISVQCVNGKVYVADVVDNTLIKNCSSSQIFIAASKSQVTIENCKNCDITCASSKLHIKSSESCKVRSFLADGLPELVDSSDITFARFFVSCPSIADMFSEVGFNQNSSQLGFSPPEGATVEETCELLQVTIPESAECQTVGGNIEEARQG